MSRISILMPVFNGMPYVAEAVNSVLAQDEQDWELVISDNGSKDGTRNYLASLNDPRIRVYLQSENLGIFGNLNFLIKQPHAPIAKILCADDKLLLGALARFAVFMEERPMCALSRCMELGDIKQYSPGGRIELQGTLPTRLNPAAAVLAFATFGNLVGNLSKSTFRPNMLQMVGGFDPHFPYAGDYEGWLRVVSQFGIDLQNEELVFIRSHEQQNSNLLNQKNELYLQINELLLQIAELANPIDLPILKRHWTIHFLSQRVPRFVRQLIGGQFRLAFSAWNHLPFGISPLACITAYPFRKFNTTAARNTTRKLLKRIIEVNGVVR